jgi:hypothetical protein
MTRQTRPVSVETYLRRQPSQQVSAFGGMPRHHAGGTTRSRPHQPNSCTRCSCRLRRASAWPSAAAAHAAQAVAPPCCCTHHVMKVDSSRSSASLCASGGSRPPGGRGSPAVTAAWRDAFDVSSAFCLCPTAHHAAAPRTLQVCHHLLQVAAACDATSAREQRRSLQTVRACPANTASSARCCCCIHA